MTAEEALKQMVGLCAADFEAYMNRICATDDPEGPHGARVAVRRLRSVLAGFSPILEPRAVAPLKAEAKLLFRRIGTLRDADVKAQQMVEGQEAADMRDHADRLRAELRRDLAAMDAAAFPARLEAFWGSAKWRRKGRKARRWRKGLVRALAGRALDRAWRDCCSHGNKVAGMTDAYRHEFRKNLKSLRYLCDFFVPLWPDGAQARFLRRVHGLQDALGTLNDLTMAAANGGLSEQTEEAFDLRFRQAMTEADDIWRKLRKSEPWWR